MCSSYEQTLSSASTPDTGPINALLQRSDTWQHFSLQHLGSQPHTKASNSRAARPTTLMPSSLLL